VKFKLKIVGDLVLAYVQKDSESENVIKIDFSNLVNIIVILNLMKLSTSDG